MTTIIINNKPIGIHATLVARVQKLIEEGATCGMVRKATGLSSERAKALIETIESQAQIGRVA